MRCAYRSMSFTASVVFDAAKTWKPTFSRAREHRSWTSVSSSTTNTAGGNLGLVGIPAVPRLYRFRQGITSRPRGVLVGRPSKVVRRSQGLCVKTPPISPQSPHAISNLLIKASGNLLLGSFLLQAHPGSTAIAEGSYTWGNAPAAAATGPPAMRAPDARCKT